MDVGELLSALMFLALAFGLFSGLPIAFVLGGVGVIFSGLGIVVGEFRPIEFYNLAPRIWASLASNLILVAAPMFIFMGLMLDRSGVAQDLIRSLQLVLRRIPGGLAISVTIVGTILAASTGIVGASVVLLTFLSLPTMLKAGYSKELATGTIASAGTLGILIPPSIMLVFLADILTISPKGLFLGALFPGLILSAFYVLYAVGIGVFRPDLAPPYEADDERPTFWGVIAALVPPLALIVLVLGSIMAGWATPTEAAGVGAAGTVAIALFKRRLNVSGLSDVVRQTSLTVGFVFFVMMAASVFAYAFRALGGDHMVLEMMRNAGLGPWGVLTLFLVLVFVLGFFFDWIEISLIALPVFAPVLASLDFGQHVRPHEIMTWVGILFAINLQASFLTPPFAFSLFFIRGVAPPEVKIRHLYRGVIPFVIIQLVGLGLCIAFPQLILWLPQAMR